MFFLTSILSLIILAMPPIFSGVTNYENLYCHVEILEDYAPISQPYIVTTSIPLEIERENFDLLYKMTWPVEDPEISSGYGNRQSCSSCSTFHRGVDFTPGIGTPVLSAMKGIITEIGDSGQYGVYIVIQHDLSNEVWHTVYAHMQRGSVSVNVGDEVLLGQHIGRVGKTGLATGPHLHFEIRVDGVKVNPLPLLNKYIVNE